MTDNNQDQIKLQAILDQLNAAKAPLLNSIVDQAAAINQALDEMPDDCLEMTVTIDGKQYPLSIAYPDIINILFQTMRDISSFAKEEIEAAAG